MKLEDVGYEYRGFKLGEYVKNIYTNQMSLIIGFDEKCELDEEYIAILDLSKTEFKSLIDSAHATSVLNGMEDCPYRFVYPTELRRINNEE